MSRHPNPSVRHSFPHFHPHVTLATIPAPSHAAPTRPSSDPPAESRDVHDRESESESEEIDPTTLLALRESIPLGQRALPIRFARVLTGDQYFLSIYIALAPSTELAQLRTALLVGNPERKASQAFPHLSLFYVADEEAHARVRLLQEMEREGVVRHSADGLTVALRCGTGGGEDGRDGGVVLEGFTGTQIWIVDCEGPVEEWKVLDKILLATSDR